MSLVLTQLVVELVGITIGVTLIIMDLAKVVRDKKRNA